MTQTEPTAIKNSTYAAAMTEDDDRGSELAQRLARLEDLHHTKAARLDELIVQLGGKLAPLTNPNRLTSAGIEIAEVTNAPRAEQSPIEDCIERVANQFTCLDGMADMVQRLLDTIVV